MFICIGIQKHWRLSWFRYGTFITFLTFSFSTREERDTIFTMLTISTSFFSQPQLNSRPSVRISTHWPNKRAAHPVVHHWTDLAQVQKSTSPPGSNLNSLRPASDLNSLLFFKNHQNSLPIASGHDVIFPIWGFYYDICDCHILRVRVQAGTPARALSRIVQSLTKPNDKI